MNPGSIVRCRKRDWVLLPSENRDVYLLRPLTGAVEDVVAIQKQLSAIIGYSLPEERVQSASFPLPQAEHVADAASAHLLWQAARLTLREGATPFRSMGRISIRPRIFQFVPLLMALRLDPVRMLIADDVGVGKTVEALLIARELYDRGEIRQICVLCPPSLCEQWQQELAAKFNLEAVIIRSGTVGQLDRKKVGNESLYRYYPIQVASIDFVKNPHNRNLFLLDCPDFVIVDEAHGAALAIESNKNQHQRHELIRTLAEKQSRHLILLTATPHSGIETAFRSLLGLLNPEFNEWDTSLLSEQQRIEVARHFVQRTRRDIITDWEGDHCFPERKSIDATYQLSASYQELFEKTYELCSDIVRSGESLEHQKRRVRYWGALALLRCVMSSPAAALAALGARHDSLIVEGDMDFSKWILESTNNAVDDSAPELPVVATELTLADSDRTRLRELGRMASALTKTADDTKLTHCAKLISNLLNDKFSPIIWCRYIATAKYVAEKLQHLLLKEHPEAQVIHITSDTGDDEARKAQIEELAHASCRVLVASDCLSEGVNLQHAFNAALHYDLPWNPNRMEQREGRVDRFGQMSKVVKAIRYFGKDNPIDGAVIEVLLNKAQEIRRALGTHVPVPEESDSVTEAVLKALFLRKKPTQATGPVQLELKLTIPEVDKLHRQMFLDAERERSNRTRFAQRALKPAEVRNELEASDKVMGDPDAVREFVLTAAQRLRMHVSHDKRPDVFRVSVNREATDHLPEAITVSLPILKTGQWIISFVSPTPEGAEYIGRNHRFTAALARYLMEEAIANCSKSVATRCGVIRTTSVLTLTTLLMLRIRYLVQQPELPELLSEEIQVLGLTNSVLPDKCEWLPEDNALRLLAEAQPSSNIPLEEKKELISNALESWRILESGVNDRITDRAIELEKSHKRVRQVVSLKIRNLTVKPILPPDLLGILILQPVVKP